jgi:protein disulfide isomerase
MIYVFLFLAFASLADIVKEKGILKLDSQSFYEGLEQNPKLLVQFHAKWCAHCRKFIPTYEEISQTLASSYPEISIAAVDVDESPDLADLYEITQYPTLKLFINNKIIDYIGNRSEFEIINWVLKQSRPIVKLLDTKEEFLELRSNPVCFVFIGNRDTPEYLKFYKAAENSDKSYFGVIEKPDIFDYVSAVEGAVVVFKHHDDNFGVTLDFDDIPQFIYRNEVPWVIPLDDVAATRVFKEKNPALFLFTKDPDGPDVLQKASKIIKSKIQLIYCDINSVYHANLASSLGLTDFKMPFALILDHELNKYLHTGNTSSDDIVDFFQSWTTNKLKKYYKSEKIITKENNIINLIGSSFYSDISNQNYLVEFYIPNCGYSRLFEPEYKIVADNAVEFVVGRLDYSKNEIQGLYIDEFPKIFYYSKGSLKGIEYYGELVASDIIKFANTLSNKSNVSTPDRIDL